MPAKPPKGQALPEYVLTVTVLAFVALAAFRAWNGALANADEGLAWYCFLPSP